MMVGFILLRDFKDGRLGNDISMTVSFIPLFLFTRFQRRSFLFCYESLMMVEINEKNL